MIATRYAAIYYDDDAEQYGVTAATPSGTIHADGSTRADAELIVRALRLTMPPTGPADDSLPPPLNLWGRGYVAGWQAGLRFTQASASAEIPDFLAGR